MKADLNSSWIVHVAYTTTTRHTPGCPDPNQIGDRPWGHQDFSLTLRGLLLMFKAWLGLQCTTGLPSEQIFEC